MILETVNMILLRRTYSVRLMDREGSDECRTYLGVDNSTLNTRPARLHRHGHILRIEEGNMAVLKYGEADDGYDSEGSRAQGVSIWRFI